MQDNAIPTTSTQVKHMKGSAQCMASAQWIDEFKAAEDMKTEIAEKEERRRKRKAALEEKAALERMNAIKKNQEVAKEHNAALLACQMIVEDIYPYYPATSGSIRFIDLRLIANP